MENTALEKEKRSSIRWEKELGFIALLLLPLGAFWTGATFFDWMLCIFLYFSRMFFVTGVYHRYFSHRTYKTSRVFQFILAWGAQTSFQKGVLWWAAHHRDHHKHSDTVEDPHSMKIYGFWYSHIGWILGPDYKKSELDKIQDFAKYPELLWLNKFHWVPPLSLMVTVFFLGGLVNGGSLGAAFGNAGLSALFVGFFLSTFVLFHGTFSINSIMHYFGKARYETGDESKNHLLLALLTMGEGWHNNHHYYQATVRQGFFWYEIDPTYMIIKGLSYLGLVWDLKPVPDHIKYSKNMKDAMRLAKEMRAERKAEEQPELVH